MGNEIQRNVASVNIVTPLTASQRLARMEENILRFRHVPRLMRVPPHVKRGVISICGFSPSLTDTWRDLQGVVMTTSGAHDFLIGKGVIPKYHVEMDSREHKIEFVRNSRHDVVYLINSQCHPRMFEMLIERCRKVVMWHSFTDEDKANQNALMERVEPGVLLVAGGTNVGMRAPMVARELGYAQFELHAMDCSYRNGVQWAGEHFTKRYYPVRIEVEGRVFETSDLMMQSTDDLFRLFRLLPHCSFRIHGDGLLEARMNLFLRDPQRALNWGWWKPVSFVLNEISVGDALPGSVPKLRRAA